MFRFFQPGTVFDFMSVFMSVLVPLMFGIFLTVFLILLVRYIRQWNKNNHSPRLTVEARVVARRANTNVSQHPAGGDLSGAHGFSTTSSTTYYVTFEVESGDRMELTVPRSEYGYIAEGDFGRLTFQGTRFLSFQRQ